MFCFQPKFIINRLEWLLHELDEFYVLGIWCRSAECTDEGLKCISGTEWTLPVVTWMWFAFKTAFLKFFSITTEPEIVPHNLGYLFLASIFFLVSGMWWFGLSLTFILMWSCPSVCLYVDDDYGNVAYVNFSIPVGRYIYIHIWNGCFISGFG